MNSSTTIGMRASAAEHLYDHQRPWHQAPNSAVTLSVAASLVAVNTAPSEMLLEALIAVDLGMAFKAEMPAIVHWNARR